MSRLRMRESSPDASSKQGSLSTLMLPRPAATLAGRDLKELNAYLEADVSSECMQARIIVPLVGEMIRAI